MTGAEIARALREAGRGALVLVIEAKGSAPAEAGAAMLVTQDGILGTVGGGAAEHRAVQAARRMLAGGKASVMPRLDRGISSDLRNRPVEPGDDGRHAGDGRTRAALLPPAPLHLDFPLGPALDQCCGGRLRLVLAPFSAADAPRFETGERVPLGGGVVWTPEPPGRPVHVYGAGHVGRALVAALAPLPFRLRWIDARAGMTDDAPAGVETVETPLPEAEAAAAPPGALHLVLTHSHALDLEIVAAALSREAAMVGLIGSATKRATFLRRLEKRGVGAAARARLVCPIGLPGLRDRRPAVIAASVAADLLQRDAALRAARRGAA